ncbi:MAG: DUF3800 domain-containing protein [Prolixibacteraceae bacterium]
MDIEVYCDESGIEALTRKDAHKYIAIGGIWITADKRDALKTGLSVIKEKYNIKGEFKWNKLSPAYFNFYKEIVDYFLNSNFIRFRVILIEAQKTSEFKFHNSDIELEFYKFYYQLLHHWILDFNNYSIFLDLKVNRNKKRLRDLHKVLINANLSSSINQVQGLPSEQSLGIQLADLFTGMVAAKFNGENTSKAKLDLISHVERTYFKGKSIAHTPKCEEKINVFVINLRGGW